MIKLKEGKEAQLEDIQKAINNNITIIGRVKIRRKVGKNLTFAYIQTNICELQVVFNGIQCSTVGSLVEVNGILRANPIVKKGLPGLELEALNISTLNGNTELKTIKNDLKVRLKNRHLDLRNQEVSQIFKLRSEALQITRKCLYSKQFIEVYTSKLAGKSIEGPLDAFSVEYFGHTAYLSISNTLPHLALMVGDIPKIFEIGPCFRGTKSKTNRHVAEYTVLDFCSSYMSRYDLMSITEEIITSIIYHLSCLNNHNAIFLQAEIEKYGFSTITYQESIDLCKKSSGKYVLPGQIDHESLKSCFSSFVWITDFPEAEKSFYVKSRLVRNTRLCYNFQLWHPQIGNLMDGAERITEPKEALNRLIEKGLNPKNFDFYLQILSAGLPPCTGTGLAFDRLMQLIFGLKNIREVILFPVDTSILPI